jgi:hypothetical protein
LAVLASCASPVSLDFPSGEGVTDVEAGEAEVLEEEEELEPVWGEGLAPPSPPVSIDFPTGEGEADEEEEAENSVTATILSRSLGRNAESREGSLVEERLAPPPPPFATDFLLEEGAADEEDEAEARSLVLHLAPVLP